MHKKQDWKVWLKGIYDVEGIPPAYVVTGSANLQAFRKVGDSLAGRHFTFRLHPLSFYEAATFTQLSDVEVFERMLHMGGFPEPFLEGRQSYYERWRKSHVDLILKEDLITLTAVRDIQSIELLIELLMKRVGSLISINSLAEDLQKSPATINKWIGLLENLYIIFRVTPFHKNIARAILKQSKIYFYDNGMVRGDRGAKLENLVANNLLSHMHFLEDTLGKRFNLHFLRDKEGNEIDFMVTQDDAPKQLVEVKWSDASVSKQFQRFLKQDSQLVRLQVVAELVREKTLPSGEQVRKASNFLKIPLQFDIGAS